MVPAHAHAITFDTLAFAKKLENSGIPPLQAEAHAEALVDALDHVLDTVATKSDIKRLESDIKRLENTIKNDMKNLEITVDLKLSKMETKLLNTLSTMQIKIIFWVIGLLSAQTTIAFSLNKFI